MAGGGGASAEVAAYGSVVSTIEAGGNGGVGIEPSLAEKLQNGLADFTQSQELSGRPAVLLVSPAIRSWLSRFIRRSVPGLNVLSYNEVPDSKEVRLVSTMGHNGRIGLA